MNPTLILTLISALASSLTQVLANDGVISSAISDLIGASVVAGTALFNALEQDANVTADLQSALVTLQDELASIQADTSADPAVVASLAELDRLVQATITGFTAAEQGADPATLPVPAPIE